MSLVSHLTTVAMAEPATCPKLRNSDEGNEAAPAAGLLHDRCEGVRVEGFATDAEWQRAYREINDFEEQLVERGSERVTGGTFHSAGHRILRRYAELLGYTRRFSILDREDATDLMGQALADLSPELPKRRTPRPRLLVDLYSLIINTGRDLELVLQDRAPQYLDQAESMAEIFRRYLERKRGHALNILSLSGGGQNGRDEIDRRTEFRAVGCGNRSRPAEHEWRSCAVFIRAAFGSRCVAALFGLNPSVVTDVEYERVFFDARLVDVIDQRSAGFIEPFTHRVVLRDSLVDSLRLVLLQQSCWRSVWSMRHKWCVPNEERLLGLPSATNEIVNRLQAFASNLQSIVAVTALRLWKSARHAMRESTVPVTSFP